MKIIRLVTMMQILMVVMNVISLPAVLATDLLSSADVLAAEQRLADLGYWGGAIDGQFDSATRQALIAFQKVEHLPITGKLTMADLIALKSAARPEPLVKGFFHIEVDLSQQVLFFVNDQRVERILPISSGSGRYYYQANRRCRAVTPQGEFQITRKIQGWRRSPLGLLYYPCYFSAGFAIHGNPSVPKYPASHGCIRIPMFAAKEFSDSVPIGTPLLVHNGQWLHQ